MLKDGWIGCDGMGWDGMEWEWNGDWMRKRLDEKDVCVSERERE